MVSFYLVDGIFKLAYLNKTCYILMQFPLKFVSNVPISNRPTLAQLIDWCRSIYWRIYSLLGIDELYCHNNDITMVSSPYPSTTPDSKVHGANMGPIWGRQDPGPHVGPMNFAIWVGSEKHISLTELLFVGIQYTSQWVYAILMHFTERFPSV